ncbi:dethiobiotin synthase [Methylovorus sp. MP688]|uniref:dethiobiotin synthase n=1 Tax=Methylovorus sp. (strain MP688) TaxID=887061 RepID=UPI0001EC445F|nr:dethiobiotin synthase [Methylovorus sp. MP688]ADQ83775.1 dethiobiotin synthase [Methylovorus sp. MP688]
MQNPLNNSKAWFVTGTDTGVGKTLISSALVHGFAAQGLRSVGMKPVAAGCEWRDGELHNDDVAMLRAASNLSLARELINPYAFMPPIAPHIAAQQANSPIVFDVLLQNFHGLQAEAERVIVEGVGGFCVPLGDTLDTADLAVALGLPVILVVGLRLGCLNHALLTQEAILSRGLRLHGWVGNHIDPDMAMPLENIAALQQRIQAPCLGIIPWQAGASSDLVTSHQPDFRRVASLLNLSTLAD